MNRKLTTIGITLTILLACFSGVEAKQASMTNEELLDITQVMEQSDIDIKSWSLYGKTTNGFVSDFSGYVQVIESLQAKSPNFKWEKIVEKNEHWNVSAYHTNSNGIREKVSVFAYPHKNRYMTYIIYIVEGQGWNSQVWNSYGPTYKDKVQLFLGDNPSIYTCVSGEKSDTMNIVLRKMAKQIVQSLDATIIDTLNEETFLSLSAYTDQWKHSIQSDQNQMNLQIGIRNDGIGGKTTITIGTPIITTEY